MNSPDLTKSYSCTPDGFPVRTFWNLKPEPNFSMFVILCLRILSHTHCLLYIKLDWNFLLNEKLKERFKTCIHICCRMFAVKKMLASLLCFGSVIGSFRATYLVKYNKLGKNLPFNIFWLYIFPRRTTTISLKCFMQTSQWFQIIIIYIYVLTFIWCYIT